ncbi:MAG: extracellular solute-binding protein [Clostridia bacterium]|nr:extracellular solute-binding protein [Clostridia bacterium]
MKKLLSLLLSLAMLLTVSVALAEEIIINESGTVDNPEAIVAGENELIFWSLFGGGEGGFMEEIVAAYNATNPAMTVRNVMLDWGEYYTKLVTAVAVGKGPDIGISHVAKLPELYDMGAVTAMDKIAEAAGVDWSQINPTTLAAATIDGSIYALPIDTHAEVFFYNREILEDAGFLAPGEDLAPPNDAEAFLAYMHELNDALPEDVHAIAFSSSGDDPYRLWWALYFQMDGAPIITEDLEITLEKEKTVAALEYLKRLYDEGLIPINLEDFYGYFMSARSAATFISGVWCTSSLENIDGFKFGVIEIPTLFEKNAQWGDSHTFILPVKPNADETRMVEAMKFMDFMSNNGSVTWARAGHVVANINVLDSAEFAEIPYRSDYAQVADHVVFYEPSPFTYAIKAALIRQIDAFIAENQTAEETYDNIIEEIEAAIF